VSISTDHHETENANPEGGRGPSPVLAGEMNLQVCRAGRTGKKNGKLEPNEQESLSKSRGSVWSFAEKTEERKDKAGKNPKGASRMFSGARKRKTIERKSPSDAQLKKRMLTIKT